MNFKLTILTLLSLVGANPMSGQEQVSGPRPADWTPADGSRSGAANPSFRGTSEPALSADVLLGRALLVQERRRHVVAKIRQRIDLFDQELIGTGTYLEQRRPDGKLQFRLELKIQVQVGNRPNSLIRVCDGDELYMYRQLGVKESLSRIDLVRVTQALEESGKFSQLGGIGAWPGLGGLPRMLRSLNLAFDFVSVEEAWLGDQFRVWKLKGRWKKDKLAEAVPERAEAIKAGKLVDAADLPAQLPNVVVLFLGKDDLFPYRIEYRRREPDRDRNQGGREGRSILTMELFEVDFGSPVDPARFKYSPGDLDAADGTERFLKDLGVE